MYTCDSIVVHKKNMIGTLLDAYKIPNLLKPIMSTKTKTCIILKIVPCLSTSNDIQFGTFECTRSPLSISKKHAQILGHHMPKYCDALKYDCPPHVVFHLVWLDHHVHVVALDAAKSYGLLPPHAISTT